MSADTIAIDLNSNPHRLSLEISSAVSILYSLFLCAAILIAIGIGIFSYAMVSGRFSVVPYIADGSIYGCQPRDITDNLSINIRQN